MPATPPRPTTKSRSPSYSTPYSTSSGRSHDSIPRTLQNAMKSELRNAVFESKTVLDILCPADTAIVDYVVDRLKQTNKITYDSLQYHNATNAEMEGWPSTEVGERSHYAPFAWLLNAILSYSRDAMGQNHRHAMLRFFAYNRAMSDGDSPLKPDIVGCSREALDASEHLSWREVEICIKVKNRWPEVVSQASAYARCCFAFQENRRFVPVLHFNHVSQEVRIGFYTRSGLVATEPFRISTEDGFRQFVRAIVGIASWDSASAAGFDASRTNSWFSVRDMGRYSVAKVYCDRKCVRGRATRVYLLKRDDLCSSSGLSLPHDPQTHSSIVLKDSWPLASHVNEGDMFGALRAEPGPRANDGDTIGPLSTLFGLPKFVKVYDVGVPNENLIPADATPWSLFGSPADPQAKPEHRIHRRVILETEGTSLLDAVGPRSLVEGIVHAMLGHYCLFKNGWLHRDVSIGNVMLMKAERRIPVTDFEVAKNITECKGFICDGDQAILWENEGCKVGLQRSGTLPFMSLDLILSWDIGRPSLHTAIDDLESFTWVLLWSVLSILEFKSVIEIAEEQWYLRMMRSNNLAQLGSRFGFLDMLETQRDDASFSVGLAPFAPLLIEWLNLANRARRGVRQTKDLESYSREIYKEYLNAGLRDISALPDSWNFLHEQL